MSKQKLSEEQALLQDAAERYLADRYSFQDRQAIVASQKGQDPTRWREFAEFGWLGLILPERYGGSGGSVSDLLVLMQSFGRSLVVEPYLSTVCMGALALVNAGSERHCARFVRDVIEGRLQLALAVAERPHGYLLHEIDTTASRQGSAYELNGSKAVVLGAADADFIVIPARTSGARRDKRGITLFMVRPEQPGVVLRSYPTIDGRRAAEVSLSKVVVAPEDVIGMVDAGLEPLQKTVNVATLALLGEALGVMNGAIDKTVAYLNMREQFGVKLASFQALRHRVADMVALSQETSSLVRRAAAVQDGRSVGNVREEIAAAKAYVGRHGMTICKECVQVNGGIAVTDEYIIGHYLKRLVVIDRLFGGVEHQIDTFLEESDAFSLRSGAEQSQTQA